MKRVIPILIIAACLITACATFNRSLSSPSRLPEAPSMPEQNLLDLPAAGAPPAEFQNQPAAQPLPTAGPYQDGTKPQTSGSGVNPSAIERMVIQNADLSIVVSDVEGRMKEITDMAREQGGYVLSSSLYQSYASDSSLIPEAQIVIKVPFEKLDQTLEALKKDVVEVQSENRSGEDVTAQYVDLKSRLKNLEAAEAQLDEIMKQATKTEDVVNVFNQLVYYREQIELVKGQMKYYEEAAALSTVTIHLIAEEKIKPLEIGPWKPQGVALQAIQDLVDFSKGFVEFLIRFVLYTLPVLIMIGIPIYLVFIGVRALIRKMRGNKPKEVQQPVQPVMDIKKKKK